MKYFRKDETERINGETKAYKQVDIETISIKNETNRNKIDKDETISNEVEESRFKITPNKPLTWRDSRGQCQHGKREGCVMRCFMGKKKGKM